IRARRQDSGIARLKRLFRLERALVYRFSALWISGSLRTAKAKRYGTQMNTAKSQNSAEMPLVGVIMGSKSDWETLSAAADALAKLGVPHECRVVSAHRTPDWMREYAQTAAGRGIEVIIAGAGGAAHLPGMVASFTTLPVLGVPVQSKTLSGMDSLLS